MSKLPNHPQIDALIRGDKETMLRLYNILFPKFLYYVRANNGTESDAVEAFHDALFQLIARAKVKGVQINGSFDGYVYTVCRNLWLKELNNRKKVVRNDGVFELKSEDEDQIAGILNQERWELFEEMLTKLTQNCAELLKAYFEKVPYVEIVKRFSYATENTAFQRIFKCKKQLTKLIKGDIRYKHLYF